MLTSVLCLLAVSAAPGAPTVEVSPSPRSAALIEALRRELPAGTLVESGGDLRVVLEDLGDNLEVRVEDASGAVRLERRLEATADKPALRVAVLLIVEVYRRSRAEAPEPRPARTETATAAPTRPPEPPAAARVATTTAAPAAPVEVAAPVLTSTPARAAPRRLWLTVGGAGSWWARPGTPTLGVQLAARGHLGRLGLGGRVGISGLCCHLSSSEPDDPAQGRVDADTLTVWGLAEASWAVWADDGLALAPELGLGAEYTRVSATATRFVGAPVEETQAGAALLFRAGARLSWAATEAWAAELGLGVLVRTPRAVVRLPEPFTAATADLDAGWVLPWVELGVRWSPF